MSICNDFTKTEQYMTKYSNMCLDGLGVAERTWNTSLRTDFIVVCRRLDALLTLGSAYSLKFGVSRRKNDTQSFLLVRRLFARALCAVRITSEVGSTELCFASKKETNPIGLVSFLVAEGGFEPIQYVGDLCVVFRIYCVKIKFATF